MSSLSVSSRGARLALPRWLPLLLVFLVAAVLRHIVVANSDVSWDLTIADKMLDGQRLYVDLIEVNPPATVYLYMLPAILGRLSGLPAEVFVDALVFLAAGVSLWLSSRILTQAGIARDGDSWQLAAVTAAVLLILPAHTFGEREHVVLIVLLPLLAVAILRAKGGRPDLWIAIVAGICGGIVAIIKPFFAVPIICVALTAAYFARSWRPVFGLENWIAAAMLATYSVAVAIAFPRFMTDVMPLALVVYVPAKRPLPMMLILYATPLWLAAWGLIALLKRRAMFEPPFSLLLAASFGFSVSFYIQQKGWPYQSYPMLALALIGFVPVFLTYWFAEPSDEPFARQKRMAIALAAGLLVGGAFSWMNSSFAVADLGRAVRAIKPHPKILALSIDLSVGFPLTREVEGTWVGRVPALWISANVWHRQLTETLDPETLSKLKAYGDGDRLMFTEDLARGRPDVILVDNRQQVPWAAWINSYPPLAAEMQAYRRVEIIGEIEILRRDEAR